MEIDKRMVDSLDRINNKLDNLINSMESFIEELQEEEE